ncbi:hypothetical protein ACFE04_027615 [Oxalis oulophora]
MQQTRKGDRRLLAAASDDNAMMKQVHTTHAPDGREVDVRPIILIIEDILSRANTPEPSNTMLEDKTSLASCDGTLEALAHIIQKVSCELLCKCSSGGGGGGGDAHATTMVLLSTLANFSWDAKVVITLAAFAVNYGEFWLVAQLYGINPLAKSIALLKQLPEILERSNELKPQFDALNKLMSAMMEVTKCMVQFKDLPSQYIASDEPPMSTAMAHVPTASYWIIRSAMACASQIASLTSLGQEYMASATEAWELSSLAHKLNSIHEHLMTQLGQCHQYIDEKRHIETYHNLVRLFETTHMDNIKNLKALIYSRDDQAPLFESSSKTKVHVEVLRRKHVLLLVSDLDISIEEIMVLEHMYKDSRGKPEILYEIVWIPIIDKSTPWNDGFEQKFEKLKSMMPWYVVHHPSIVESAVVKYIKEVWRYQKKAIVVPMDLQGKVLSLNALHMMYIWGNMAFPFDNDREEALWKAEAWKLELLVDGIDMSILQSMAEGRFICLYGGEEIDWIRKFTSAAMEVARAAKIPLDMVYVGKSNGKERVRKLTSTITEEKLSRCWSDQTSVWFFWARLESMLYSKLQQGKTVEDDHIMQEVMTMLSFDGSEQGWAVFWHGSSNDMARAKGATALTSMMEFERWRGDAEENGFMFALHNHFQALHTPHHCNRLILPGINGAIPEKVVCAECGRQMEKYFMYRCCVD